MAKKRGIDPMHNPTTECPKCEALRAKAQRFSEALRVLDDEREQLRKQLAGVTAFVETLAEMLAARLDRGK
jgi:hypothetical protein